MINEQLQEAILYLKDKKIEAPEIGIILGTGLGDLVHHIEIIQSISYNQIPFFPSSLVEYHKGKLHYGILGTKRVLVMQGRFHLYEGYDLFEITFPIRVLHGLGIQQLLISNASGAINSSYKKGELMLIEDHINLQGGSPLAFKGVEKFGERFVDMSTPYSTHLNNILIQTAAMQKIKLNVGVYAAVVGPHLETRSEYRMLQIIGADSVGMSTVPEVIVSNHLKLPCAAISVLTDECDPKNLQPINVPEIITLAKNAEPKLTQIFVETLKLL